MKKRYHNDKKLNIRMVLLSKPGELLHLVWTCHANSQCCLCSFLNGLLHEVIARYVCIRFLISRAQMHLKGGLLKHWIQNKTKRVRV
jgi:hypothetical protein